MRVDYLLSPRVAVMLGGFVTNGLPYPMFCMEVLRPATAANLQDAGHFEYERRKRDGAPECHVQWERAMADAKTRLEPGNLVGFAIGTECGSVAAIHLAHAYQARTEEWEALGRALAALKGRKTLYGSDLVTMVEVYAPSSYLQEQLSCRGFVCTETCRHLWVLGTP